MGFKAFIIVTILASFANDAVSIVSNGVRPVIGVLTQPLGATKDGQNLSNIDVSYVRWLQAGGAMVVPILFNDTSSNIENTFHKLNGVYFTGGPDKASDYDRYYSASVQLFDLSMKHSMPLWGTCLGFQMIGDIIAGNGKNMDIMFNTNAENLELPLNLAPSEALNSKMLGDKSIDFISKLITNKYTTNWHHYGISPASFDRYLKPFGMKILSTNEDIDGFTFVSTMEHNSKPIYATQWHPEANAFDRDHSTVDHSVEAIKVMQYFANFFVNEARLKGTGPGDLAENDLVDIENYPVIKDPKSYSMKYVFYDDGESLEPIEFSF